MESSSTGEAELPKSELCDLRGDHDSMIQLRAKPSALPPLCGHTDMCTLLDSSSPQAHTIPRAERDPRVFYPVQSSGHVSTMPVPQLWEPKAQQPREFGDKCKFINPRALTSQDASDGSRGSLISLCTNIQRAHI